MLAQSAVKITYTSEPKAPCFPCMSIDHDQNFKELISTFFLEFLELFLPEIARTIDPHSITFLQQEYFADLVEGEEKIIDLLVEVKRAGQETTFIGTSGETLPF